MLNTGITKGCKKARRFLLLSILSLTGATIFTSPAQATMGNCSDCHTMHNSQNSAVMRYDTGATPLANLLRSTCYGCHARAGAIAPNILDIGSSRIPQVYHNDGVGGDLAGGNFAYIDNYGGAGYGSGASDGKGHNINGLGGIVTDANLAYPPGGILRIDHYGPTSHIQSSNLTCAGEPNNQGRWGCHGNRNSSTLGLPGGIGGAHHTNQSGSLTPAWDTEGRAGYAYRFLVGVWGYEDTDWQNTTGPNDHNEYWAQAQPARLDGCGLQGGCHGQGGVRPPHSTISEFCATCHGNFHTLGWADLAEAEDRPAGVGNDPTGANPWLRHPTDFALPAGGEYASYGSYNIAVPVARNTNGYAAPPAPSGVVTNTNVSVMCLSCHVAHASDYEDMLRFDYSLMIRGGAPGTGCFACHSYKN